MKYKKNKGLIKNLIQINRDVVTNWDWELERTQFVQIKIDS